MKNIRAKLNITLNEDNSAVVEYDGIILDLANLLYLFMSDSDDTKIAFLMVIKKYLEDEGFKSTLVKSELEKLITDYGQLTPPGESPIQKT